MDGSIADASGPDASGVDAAEDATVVSSEPPACQPVPPPEVLPAALPVVAGTRLIPRTLADPSADGLEIPWAVHDTVLDADCEPVRFADQKFHCAPIASLADSDWLRRQGLVDIGFADAGRTAPVAVLRVALPPPPGAVLYLAQSRYVGGSGQPPDTMDSSCNPTDLASWRVGAARAETSYWRSNLTMVTVPEGYSLYDLAAQPASVELEEVDAQLSGSIAIRELHGADGSRIFSAGLYDTRHAVQVGFERNLFERNLLGTTIDKARLLPLAAVAATGLYFKPPLPASGPDSPDLCNSPSETIFDIGRSNGCDVSALPFISEFGGDKDPPDLPALVHHVVKTDTTLYTCHGTQVHTSVLAECAPSSLSDWTLASQVSVGGGRLTTQVWKIGDAMFAPPYPGIPMFLRENEGRPQTFHDTVLGVDCVPKSAADGELRCLPLQGSVGYSDPACKVPVAYLFNFITGTPPYVARGSLPPGQFQNDLRGQITMFSVGAPRPDAHGVWQISSDGECSSEGGVTSFELGPEVPPSLFAAFEIHDAPSHFGAGAGTSAAPRSRTAPVRRAAKR